MPQKSKQPRFNQNTDNVDFFLSSYKWLYDVTLEAPIYHQDSRTRDRWLRTFVKREPNLAGVINTVTAIDKNRGWSMVGGRNQVMKFTDVLHNIECAPGISGWRPAISHASESFWTTDMGTIMELGRDGRSGPLRAMYNVDPTRCLLTGNSSYPLKYYPRTGTLQKWSEDDFIRVTSQPSTDEVYNGLGYCAVSRCLELTKLMIAVYDHDKETLGAKAPRGLLMLQGISQKQWTDAMAARDVDIQSKGYQYFSNVAVLASAVADVDAKLVALSNLPVSFNLREWTDMVMYGYALCFGYDPSEFWPVQFGALGRGTEAEVQHEKATGKGRLDFVLGYQEQLQQQLPDSLAFAFDQRDEKGDLLHAQVDKAWADFVKVLADGNLANRDELRVLLSEQNVIPTSWVPTPDELSNDQEDVENDPIIDPNDPRASVDKDGNPIGAAGESGASASGASGASGPTEPKGKEGQTGAEAQTGAKPAKKQPVKQMALEATAQRRTRDILMEMPQIHRAISKYPAEPIITYRYPTNTITVMCNRADDLLQRVHYQSVNIQREMPEDAKEIVPVERENKDIVDLPTLLQLLALIRPEAPQPQQIISRDTGSQENVIHVHSPDIVIPVNMTVEKPDPIIVNVPKPDPVIINMPKADPVVVNVPRQATPIISVPRAETPIINVAAPIVNVSAPNVTVQPPVINTTNEINMPEGSNDFVILRDKNGNIIGIEEKQ